MRQKFQLVSQFQPTGDQPQAIEKLVKNIQNKEQFQTLLGVTGSGKTFTMANVIERIQKPTIVMAHNKTLAAQLCGELQEFFPNNAVCYFVSYYDYYQPEAYVAKTDTYIEKDASINEEINKYRHAATNSLLTRDDVIIVASVSAIYGLGSVDDYNSMAIEINSGEEYTRDKLLRRLTDLQYSRSFADFKQGMFNVMGDVIEIFPPSSDNIVRLDFFGDEIDSIQEADSFTGEIIKELDGVKIFPAKHNVTTKEKIDAAVERIKIDLEERLKEFRSQGRLVEAERLETRTNYDLEMMLEMGYCTGIENYVRYFNNGDDGQPPSTLFDYYPDDFLMIIDESHITIPQVGGMHAGNFSRKQSLIEHGFRLPSSHDNRPLKFEEFEGHMRNAVFVSATPSKYEYEHSGDNIVEQIIRPTGLIDPLIDVRPTKNQVDDLLGEIKDRVKAGERVLVTTLTKKSSEDLTEYLTDNGCNVKYLHSDIDTMERIEILRSLRQGDIDIIVGINLLREGLDLPEVSLVAIVDADKEGFLRSREALIQTIGRAARNANGTVIMYADRETKSMKAAIDETQRRRKIQMEYNKKHGITPTTVTKKIKDIASDRNMEAKQDARDTSKIPKDEIPRLIKQLEDKMELAVNNLDFEQAAEIRDQIVELERKK